MLLTSFSRTLLILTGLLFTATGYSNDLVIWANNGEDKITQDELRATANPLSVINSVWDGNKIKLFGARNETVAFCLILEAPTQTANNVIVQFNKLNGPNGELIQSGVAAGDGVLNWVGRPIELFYVRYLQIRGIGQLLYEDYDERHVPERFRRPWTGDGFAIDGTGWNDRPDHDKYYPDIAVPLELESPFDIVKGHNQCIWTDIFIPKSSSPGLYSGHIDVSSDESPTIQIPIELKVRNFTLPDKPSLKTMLVLGYEDINQRYLGEQYPSEQSKLEMSRKILDKHFQLAHRHRISLIAAEPDDQDKPNPNWLSRFSGELFTAAHGYDGPGTGIGNEIYSIGTYGSWDWKNDGENGMRAHTDAWVNWFDSNAANVDYFLYLIDESDNFSQTEQWASWIKNNPGQGHRMPSFATMDLLDGINNTPSLDIPCAATYHATASEVEAAAQQILSNPNQHLCQYNGMRPYMGSFATEDDGVALRVTAWSQFKKGIDFNWFYWHSTYYNNFQGDTGETDVFNSAFTFGAISGQDPVAGETGWNYSNGDGVLFYPGTDKIYPSESYELAGPIASLRLKHWRRGIQDGDYLTMAAKIDPEAVKAIVSTMIPKVLWEYGVSEPTDPTYVRTDISWSTDPDQWESARSKLADIIESDSVPDTDNDGIPDSSDNCTLIANPDQRDTDQDGFGNICDADLDNNGSVSFADLNIFRSYFGSQNLDADFDGNGSVSFADLNIFRQLFGLPPGPSGQH